ncbi:MAG: transglycosylase SLT domain-containing protein, partial [Candidatus Promineifilaceae bacterium]
PSLAAGVEAQPPPPPTVGAGTAGTRPGAIRPPSPTPSPAATPTPTVPPTATPSPAERLQLAADAFAVENFALAADHFQAALASDELGADEGQRALLRLGQALLALGQPAAAAEALDRLLSLLPDPAGAETPGPDPTGAPPLPAGLAPEALFQLGKARQAASDCAPAIPAFERYLEANPGLAAYVQPEIGACYLALDDRPAALRAYEAAAAANSHPLTELNLRLELASLYEIDENYTAALAQYDAILAFAQTDNSRGQATYRAGRAQVQAGNLEAGYQLYQGAIRNYPRAYESYLALSALVEAGQPVDDFQRGLVDYYAEVYEPAVSALARYLDAVAAHSEDAHLYLAWSYEGLGDLDGALAHVDAFIEHHLPVADGTGGDAAGQARGWLERGLLLGRAGQLQAATESFNYVLASFPAAEQAPQAGWLAAVYLARLGDVEAAAAAFRGLAEAYPAHPDAAEALYRAGLLSQELGAEAQAQADWTAAVERYPSHDYGAAALGRLLTTMPEAERAPWLERAAESRGEGYYQVRLRDIAAGRPPFEPAETLALMASPADRRQAESWLAERLGLEASRGLADLSAELSSDERLIRGQKLWQLGLRAEAKRELESLRAEYSADALASYQLALFFRDLGLYRSSILAAASLLRQLDATALEAPRAIGRLAYPAYYADLVMAEAERYGYDPLLQFALIRQESLYESFATSSAVAQGLSQVIPETGAYIARQLAWPDYKNEDLYRPYVGIPFGAFYLDQQLDDFDDHIPVALAAYNGGPGNAARWYAQAGGELDAMVENITFAETRQYVMRIYAGHAIYRALYGAAEG